MLGHGSHCPPHLFSLMIGGGEGMWCWCIFITLPSSLPLISLPPFLLRFSIFFSSLWTPGLCLCVTLWEQGPFARLRTFSNSTLSMVWMGKRGALTSLLWKVTHPGFVVLLSLRCLSLSITMPVYWGYWSVALVQVNLLFLLNNRHTGC